MASKTTSEAFEALFRTHYPRAVALAAHVCGDRATAEDLTQEVFWRLHEALKHQDIENVGAWITTALTRRCLNERRRLGRLRAALARHGLPNPVTEEFSFVHQPALAAALRSLSAQQRLALLLVGNEGMTIAEAASVMGCAPSTVRVHLGRARERARSTFSQHISTRD